MIVSYFDYTVIGILLFVNIRYWDKLLFKDYGCLLSVVFMVLLPLFSIMFEFKLKEEVNKVCFDAFTMAYTFLKFPLYWGLFLFQSLIIALKPPINKYLLKK